MNIIRSHLAGSIEDFSWPKAQDPIKTPISIS